MMTIGDSIQSFKRLNGEPLHETWLRFKKLVLQYPTHSLPHNVLLQYFYWTLDSVNKGVADQLSTGGLMKQPYAVATQLLDGMTTINKAEMAGPKVTGRDMPPRHVRAQEFKRDEKKAELARQRKHTEEAKAKRQIPIDINEPPWARSSVNAIWAYGAAHEIDQMIAANLAAEAKAKANNKDQNNNTLRTIVSLQGVTPSTKAQIDETTH
uniref:Integrase core domain containing protein n=1 Tax=Solanum tuberosum TaxID=4113 RepID=M1DZT9_SOLTU